MSSTYSAPATFDPDGGPPHEPMWRCSVDRYHAMIRAGILTEDDRVELLDGWLVMKMTKNPPHRSSTLRTRKAIASILPPEWSAWPQEAITLIMSEPEPDVVVVRGDEQRYPDRNPGPEDVALVVEVADTTLARDRGWKKRLYAEARIPTYWIVNLIERRLEVYTDPTGTSERPDYRGRRDFGPADEVSLRIESREVGRVAVRELLP